VYQDQKSIADFEHNIETVLYRSEVYTNGWPCSKTAADEKLSRRPSTFTTENTGGVHAMILGNQRVAVDELVYHLHISNGFGHRIIHE
jgi:hypothetical protein